MSEAFPPEHSGEVMVPLIESIACDIPRVLIGNILNSGDFVPGIPRDFAVEIPTLVSKRGIEGIQTSGLPDAVLAQIWRDRVGPVTIELAAYEAGKPGAVARADADRPLDALPGPGGGDARRDPGHAGPRRDASALPVAGTIAREGQRMKLQDKVAIITGAASGIGAGTAEVFAEQGARLVLVDRDGEGLEKTAQRAAADAGHVVTYAGDVADPETARGPSAWRGRCSAASTSSSTTPGS